MPQDTNDDVIKTWMARLREAWLAGDVDSAVALFSHCDEYGEDPFMPSLTSSSQIREAWKEIREQKELTINFTLMAWTGRIATVRWKAKFMVKEPPIRSFDGIYVVEFDDSGECRRFYQWWNEAPQLTQRS